jgi:hypothetical protein
MDFHQEADSKYSLWPFIIIYPDYFILSKIFIKLRLHNLQRKASRIATFLRSEVT